MIGMTADAVVEMRAPGRILSTNTFQIEAITFVEQDARPPAIVLQTITSVNIQTGSLGSCGMEVLTEDPSRSPPEATGYASVNIGGRVTSSYRNEIDTLTVVNSDVGIQIDVPNAFKEIPTPRFFWG
jgi:hypothetical protein